MQVQITRHPFIYGVVPTRWSRELEDNHLLDQRDEFPYPENPCEYIYFFGMSSPVNWAVEGFVIEMLKKELSKGWSYWKVFVWVIHP